MMVLSFRWLSTGRYGSRLGHAVTRLSGCISIDFDADVQRFRCDASSIKPQAGLEYMKGVAGPCKTSGYVLCGWEGVVGGDVPVGAGLSSSAALELATARAFAAVSSLAWDAKEMANAVPASRERVDRRELRHHGPDDLCGRPVPTMPCSSIVAPWRSDLCLCHKTRSLS